MTAEEYRHFKTGYVAIVGAPNVGKSTLMNSLLQQKLSIVTRKPQTTRQRVLGIFNENDTQIIFLDTPGLLKPKYLLHEKMLRNTELALRDSDVILLLTEVSHAPEVTGHVNDIVLQQHQNKPILLVINKVDTIDRKEVLPMIASVARVHMFKEIVPVSALKRENLDDLLKTIVNYLPVHPPLYPVDAVSEHPERFFVAELIREQIFEHYRNEIPYSAAVEIVEFRERKKGKTFVNADIILEKDSQKGIVIGKNGEALKKIGQAARKEIEDFLDQQVFLEIRVKVREHWREKEAILKRLGYDAQA